MLEPAAQGRPVVFGPFVQNFAQEVALLKRAGACVEVGTPSELAEVFGRLLTDRAERERLARAGIAVVEAQKGATAVTLAALLERCLPDAPGARGARGARGTQAPSSP
jgi:3-deoxy-D-manno-octulosonic-acid transferase